MGGSAFVLRPAAFSSASAKSLSVMLELIVTAPLGTIWYDPAGIAADSVIVPPTGEGVGPGGTGVGGVGVGSGGGGTGDTNRGATHHTASVPTWFAP